MLYVFRGEHPCRHPDECRTEERVCGEYNFKHDYGRSFCRIYGGTLWIYADFEYDQITVPDDIEKSWWRGLFSISELNSSCFAQACEAVMSQAGQWFARNAKGRNKFIDGVAAAMLDGRMRMGKKERECLESLMFTWYGCHFFIPPQEKDDKPI